MKSLGQYAPVIVHAMRGDAVTGLNCHREKIVVSVWHGTEFDGQVMDGARPPVQRMFPAEIRAALPSAGAEHYAALWAAIGRHGLLDEVEDRADWQGRRFLFKDAAGEEDICLEVEYADLLAAKPLDTVGPEPAIGLGREGLPDDPPLAGREARKNPCDSDPMHGDAD